MVLKNTNIKLSTIALFVSVVALITSCQKVVQLDLNSAAPQLVVEGSLSTQAAPYSVKLSKTVNFSDLNTFPPCTGAAVTLSDNAGNSETLVESTPGTYTAGTLQGTVGREYKLLIVSENKNYQSTSTIPSPVNIDTVVQVTNTGGFGGNSGSKSLRIFFTDPAGVDNYYRLIEILNHDTVNSISITNDFGRDGHIIQMNFRRGNDGLRLKTGDSVVVQLQSIDKYVYEYFRTFNLSGGEGSFNSSSPANPTSNVSNGALGYFSAYSVSTKTIVVQ